MKKFLVLNDTTVQFDGQEAVTKSSKSEMFRFLFDQGVTVAEISKATGSHYSFVYGVISSSREIVKTETSSKSDEIRKMVDQGMTPGAIAKALNSNYSFVHSVVKKYKNESAATVVGGTK